MTSVAIVVPALVLLGMPQPIQGLLATALLLFLPGFTLVRLAPPRDPVLGATLAIALSLALAAAVSTALLYAGAWSWQLCVAILGGISLVGGVLSLRVAE